MRKKIIISCVVIIVLAALIVLLPYPQRIKRTFYGVNSFDGEKANISFDMTYYRYLFKRDTISGKVTVTCGEKTTVYKENDLQYITDAWPLNNEDETLHFFIGWYFNADLLPEPILESVRLYLSKDFNKMVLYHEPEDSEPKQYIGNIEQGKEQETIQYFEEYIK